jgi:hypothetical protein
MIRIRIAMLAVAVAAGLFTPTLAVAASASRHELSVASVQDEPDPGATKPANCGTPNTPPCEA